MTIILVEATTTHMTKVPQQSVDESSVAEYVCETDSASPEPAIVLWHVDGVPVEANNGHTVENDPSPDDYHGQKTKSTLRLITKREMNKKKVKCVLGNDQTKFDDHNLNVTCKYLLVHVLHMA